MKYRVLHVSPDDQRLSVIAPQLYPQALLPVQQSGDKMAMAFLKQCFLLECDDVPAGKIAVYENPHITTGNKKTLLLGNYECIDDDEAAKHLLQNVFAAYPDHTLIGPMNGSTWDNYRFCTNAEAGWFFSEMVNMPYYPKQWKDNGFSVSGHYASTIERRLEINHPETLKREAELLQEGIRFRNIDMENFDSELERIFPLCTEAFSRNFLYSPISFEQFSEKYISVRKYIRPEFVFLAEDADGKLAGFVFNIPDYFSTQEKRLVIKTIARDPAPRYKGLGDVFGHLVTRAARTHGYTAIVHALIYTGNYSYILSEKYASEAYKTYELYSRES